MDQIEYFFSRVFGRLFDRARYAVTDATETQIRSAVEKPFEPRPEANKQE
jgi:hypothetical protein